MRDDKHEPASHRASANSQTDHTARTVRLGCHRLLLDMGYAAVNEVTLTSGRRVDLMAVNRSGDIAVIEIKSSAEDFRGDQKWQTYLAYADSFYFAVSPNFPRQILPANQGLILADRYGGEIIREAVRSPLNTARRKTLIKKLAYLAARRLAQSEIDADREGENDFQTADIVLGMYDD